MHPGGVANLRSVVFVCLFVVRLLVGWLVGPFVRSLMRSLGYFFRPLRCIRSLTRVGPNILKTAEDFHRTSQSIQQSFTPIFISSLY